MPNYKVNNETYTIPDNEVELFESDFPDAQLHYQTSDGEKYTIYAKERKDFLADFPDATELGWKSEAPEQEPAGQMPKFDPEKAGTPPVPMFDDKPNAIPLPQQGKEYNTTLAEGFKQEARNLGAGVQALAGESLNLFSGTSLDDQSALRLLNEAEKAGMSVTDYTKARRMDMLRSMGKTPMDEGGRWSKEEAELLEQDAKILKVYEDALKAANGNVNQAKKILEEQAQDLTRGDAMIGKAAETLSQAKENKGWAWFGGLLPQMAGNASAIALGYLTKGRSAGLSSVLMGTSRALGLGSMAGLTASTAGMSMVEAREKGASTEDVWAVGMANAAIEWLTEKIPFDTYTKKIYGAVKSKLSKGVSEVLSSQAGREELERLLVKANQELGGKLFSGKNLSDYIKSIAEEAGGEAIAEALQTITPIIYLNPEEYPELSDVIGAAWEGAKGGLVMGAMLGGASKAIEHALNKDRRMSQGYVDVAVMQTEGSDPEVVEVLSVDDENGIVTVLQGGEAVEVKKDAIEGDRYRFTYADFENARLTELEDEAIDNETVTEGQAKAAGDRVAITATELDKALAGLSEEQKQAILNDAEKDLDTIVPEDANEAYQAHREALRREREVKETLSLQQEKAKLAIRDELTEKVGGQFWREQTDTAGDNPLSLVETGMLTDGTQVYIVSEVNEAGETIGVTENGRKMVIKNDMLQDGTQIMTLTEFIDQRYAENKGVAEQTRMLAETERRNAEVMSEAIMGSKINLGTEEAPRYGTVNTAPNADGVIVLLDDGGAVSVSMDELANILGKGAILTDAELASAESAEILGAEAALKAERAQNPQQVSSATDEAVVSQKTAEEAMRLPLKADGSVDQTTLWNQDPERWAQWNDEQRRDGGANSLAYINGAIVREQAKFAEIVSAYNAEPDFDARNAMESELAVTQERLNRLTALQQNYAPQVAQQDQATEQTASTEETQAAQAEPNPRERSVESEVARLYDLGLSDEEVVANLDAKVAKAQKALDAQRKKAPKMGADENVYIAKKREHQQKMSELQQELDFWNGALQAVNETLSQQSVIPDTSGSVAVEDDSEPQNAVEFAARELGLRDGGIKLLWDSFKHHTGYGESERSKFFGLFRTRQNGGMTIEEAGERLMELDRENNTGFFDQNDPNAGMNAILDALGDNQTMGELRSYTARQRQEEAQREADAAYSAMMADYEAAHGMSAEEVAAYDAVMNAEAIQKGLNETEYNELNSIFAEEISEYDTRTEESFGQSDGEVPSDVERGGEAVPEGSDNVLQSPQSDYTAAEGTAPEGEQSTQDADDVQSQDGNPQVQPAAVESSLDEDMPDFTNSASAYFPSEEMKQKFSTMRARINDWAQKLGVQVRIMETLDDVVNPSARKAVLNGNKVYGYFDPATGEVAFYLPDFLSIKGHEQKEDEFLSEIDKTYIHEVVAHRGLRGLLGEEKYGELCDKVWESMTDGEKAYYMRYAGVNGNTRAAADEYIAHLAEDVDYTDNRTIWDKIVDYIKELFDAVEIPVNISNESMADLLRASYNRLNRTAKAATNANANLQAEGNTMFRSADGSLVGMHNISEDKLRKVIKQGGLANPSTAVVNIAEYLLDGYGDISLIMPSSLVDPDTGDNVGTYSGDAWTPTYPPISRQVGDAGWKTIKDRIRSAIGDLSDLYSDIVNGVNNYLDDNRTSKLEFVFLKEKGIEPEVKYKGADGLVGIRNLEAILGVGLREGWESYEKYKAASPMAKRSFNMWVEAEGNKAKHRELREMLKKEPKLAEVMQLSEDLSFARFDSFTYHIKKTEREAGKIDTYDTMSAAAVYVDANNLRPEFEQWLESLMQEAGAKEVFFAGYTRDGDRIYKDNTLENVSRHMSRQGRTNAYDDKGLSATKSALLERFTTLAQIRRNKGRLRDERTYNKEYDALRDRLYDIISQISDMEAISSNPFLNLDYAESRLQDALTKRNPIAYLNKEYGYKIDPTGEFAEELKSFIKDVQKMPAKYFETKFERPVYLNEFAAAVMPTTTSEDIKQAVSEARLPIFEYDSSVEGSRKEATLKATEVEGVRFRTAPSDRVLYLFNQARAGELGGKPISVGSLTKEGKEYLERISGIKLKENVSFVLNPSDLNHIYNDHYGKNEKDTGNNIPLNDYDIRRLVDVIAFPTRVVFGEDKQGRKVFYFLSETPSGTYNLMEIYANKKGNLTAKTYYKTKKGATQRVMELESLLSTSETYSGATLSDAKIPILFDIANQEDGDIRFRIANDNQAIFVSNAAKAVEGIKQEKATPEQWLKMIEKNGGLKAGEDKWMGLSDWLKESDKKTLTKQEVLDFVNENMIQIEEVHYAAGAEDDAENTYAMIERILQEKFDKYIAEYYEQNSGEDDDLYGGDSYEYAMDKLREEMSDEFPYTIERSNSVVYLTFPYEETDDLQEWADKLGIKFAPQNPINSTRLDYTTDGLNNKHEIALIVPSTEPWESDEVHFGDAGDGRAVAWIRFGETWEQRPSPQISRKVLVIDEIQSKRHQEGRERGYRTSREDVAKATEAFQSFNRAMKEKYGENVFPSKWSEEDQAEFDRLRDEHARVSKSYDKGIPDAPFDKNWHELAMKRMLRYAAENGYDVIAWTKGEQQAERYNLGKFYSGIERQDNPAMEGRRFVLYGGNMDSFMVNDKGVVIESTINEAINRPLSDIVGKELAVKMMQMEDNDMLDDADITIGGEGMKGFYDKILPAFMNKYGKKWGVKVEDIALPGLEDGKLTMHSVPVTEEMKASVMEGQVMFRARREDESAMEFTQSEVDAYYTKYNDLAETIVSPVNEETAREHGYTLEELKKIYGQYEAEKDIITIFAQEENYDGDRIEITLFHESIHKLADFYPYLVKAGEWMMNNADRFNTFAGFRDIIVDEYESEWHNEEMLCYVLSACMNAGVTEEVMTLMPQEYRKNVEQILKEIGYDTTTEGGRRKARRSLSESAVSEDLRDAEGKSESGRKGKETKGSSRAEFSAEERRLINDYFPGAFTDPIEQARQEVDQNPTDAQKEAGNYRKGHLHLDGYNITIENPKGSIRRGTDSKGHAWENTLNNDYGYIRGTEGVDGDHIDVYLSDNPTEGNVFVIDQVNPQTREFDEHKVMYGFNSAEEARDAYLANFSEGWNGLGTITEVSKDEFKKWIASSHRKTKPFSEYKSVRANEMLATDESDLRYRVVTNQETLNRLNGEPTIKVYRAMQLIDGKLYPPMSAKVDGKLREPIELGQWEEAEERPDLADDKGRFKLDKGNKTSVPARYNPYFHTSRTPLNDQFSSAQDRPNLVTVEVEIPESELTSGYKAEKAKDSVGEKEWKAGVVQGKLSGTRKIILSRWDKPIRIVPDSEVADRIVEMFEDRDITMPSNVVTPSLRAELEKRGVPFVVTNNNGKPVSTIRSRALDATPTDELVTKGLQLTPAQTAELAGNVFAALPEESRKKITDGLNGNILGLQDAILQIPASLAAKESWSDEDRAVAEVVAEQMTKMAGDMTRPFSAPEALWLLYNNLNRATDLVSEASRALVRRNLGFDNETLAQQEQAKEDVRFRSFSNANNETTAKLYNKGAVNVWTRLKESFVDMNASVDELVKAMVKRSGKEPKGFEDIRLALNQQSSKGLAAMEGYELKFLNPMLDAISDIIRKTKKSYDQIVRYVILKHGLERNDSFAKRDAREYYGEMFKKVADRMKNQSHAQRVVNLSEAKKALAAVEAKMVNAKGDKLERLKDEREAAMFEVTVAELVLRGNEKQNESDLKARMDAIDAGTDAKYQELRNKDYSGITSMFYDQLDVDRNKYDTEEEYQAALMEAKQDKYATLADVEAAAQAEVDAFEKDVNTAKLWKRINAATKETLRQQYEANMISKEQYETLRDMFQFYVPLRGFADNTAEDMYTYYRKPNSTGYTKPILGAEGRKTEAESPFGWIAAMANSAIASNVKNEAKLALFYFVSNRPDNGIATISKTWFEFSHTDPATGKKVYKPAYPPFTEGLSSDQARADFEQWQEDMKAKRAAGQAYESGQRLNLGNAVVNISDRNRPEHIVNVKVAGKDYTIIINGNPRAAQAINGDLNIEATAGDYSKVFGPILRWMSSVNTSYNPEFWITNMQRDVLFTLMNVTASQSPAYRKKFFSNYAKAFKVISMAGKNERGTLGNSYIEKMYQEFVENGGVTGYTQIKDNEVWEKDIENYMKSANMEDKKMGRILSGTKDALHAFHRFGESMEQFSRFAAFLTSREMGMSMAESINSAKEITVNFNRKGSGKMISWEETKKLTGKDGKPLNGFERLLVWGISSMAPLGRRFIVFFNASIQGLNAMYKLYKNNPSKMTAWSLGYLSLGVMQALLHAMMDDDDDYLDIPQYERRTSLMLGGNGTYLKWALPQEARAFYALGDLAVESIMGRNPHQNVIMEALKIGADIAPVNPTEGWKAFLPSVAVPFVELMINEDWKGEPIYNEQKWLTSEERKRTAKAAGAYQGTGKMYIWISEALNNISGGDDYDAGLINIQPEKMEHLVQSAFGGTIRTADKFFNTIMAAIDPEEEWTVKQTPFLNRLLTINDERFRNVHVNEVYDYYKAEAEHAKTLQKKYTKDRDMDAYRDLMSSDEMQWSRIYERYKKPIMNLQEKIKVAEGTSERKQLMQQQDELKRRMIKEISELP